jgi:hypothetical protein
VINFIFFCTARRSSLVQPEPVDADILYSIRCVDVYFVGFINQPTLFIMLKPSDTIPLQITNYLQLVWRLAIIHMTRSEHPIDVEDTISKYWYVVDNS